ncbi:MAG: zinc-binding dehydrogenase [Anaerolineae bacterium]|nr:zinc-binding dehydrogenase [Anaerolineae bacterium]
MKALRFHGPKDIRYEELPDRELGPDEALLAPRAVGICGTDLEIYQGSMFYFTSGLARWPVIPGHEWSAEVLAVGERVQNVKPGDKVVGECTVACGRCEMCRLGFYNECPNRQETGILNLDGAFADKMYYPASFLHKFEKMSFEEAALVEPTAVAVWGTKLVNVTPADTVAVLGPGPIGLLAMQVARAYGARRIAMVGRRETRLQLAEELGADGVINTRTQDLVQEAKRMTSGRLFDVVLEATGNPQVTEDLMKITRPRGRISLMGLFNSQMGKIDLDALVVGNITLQGSLGSPGVWDETVSLIERGLVRCRPLITHRFALQDVAEAFVLIQDRTSDVVKVSLRP